MLVLAVLVVFLAAAASGADAAATGGCALCTVVVSLAEQYAVTHGQAIDEDLLDRLCELLPSGGPRNLCKSLVATYGQEAVARLVAKDTPDVVCRALHACDNAQCNLFPPPSSSPPSASAPRRAPRRQTVHIRNGAAGINESPWQWLMDLINRFANVHEPLVDVDGDGFSPIEQLRGGSWRGKDCNDADGNAYPGRLHGESCNGINASLADQLCGSSDRRGTIVIGDSAGAHFHIPPKYVNASAFDASTFDDLLSCSSSSSATSTVTRRT